MDGTAVVFLVIGAVGLAVVVLSMIVGELDLGVGDDDGPFSLPAIAALIGGIGFGGAAAQGLQLSGDLTGIDVAALLRRISSVGGDGVTRVPITSDGDGSASNGAPT